MSDRLYAALIAFAMLCMLAMLGFVCGDNRRLVDDAATWRNRVVHLQDFCEQRPDGSAECRANAFDPYTTTTTTSAR